MSDGLSDPSADDIDRATLNLSGAEAIELLDGVEHLRKTTSGERNDHYQSIEDKLNRSLGTENNRSREGPR